MTPVEGKGSEQDWAGRNALLPLLTQQGAAERWWSVQGVPVGWEWLVPCTTALLSHCLGDTQRRMWMWRVWTPLQCRADLEGANSGGTHFEIQYSFLEKEDLSSGSYVRHNWSPLWLYLGPPLETAKRLYLEITSSLPLTTNFCSLTLYTRSLSAGRAPPALPCPCSSNSSSLDSHIFLISLASVAKFISLVSRPCILLLPSLARARVFHACQTVFHACQTDFQFWVTL